MIDLDIAPLIKSWVDHLKDITDRELTLLASDYCWLVERRRPLEQREHFRERRFAIMAECESRGLAKAAQLCRPCHP
jgi:hypothetical protein